VVALLAQRPVHLAHLLAQPVDPRELLAPRVVEDLRLEAVDARLERVGDRVPGVRQRVEDAVDDVVLGLGALGHQRVVKRVEHSAVLAPDRDHEVAGDVDVDLDRLRHRVVAAGHARGVEDDEDVALVDVELRPLAELARVLERHRVQPELLAQARELIDSRVVEVQPEEVPGLALGGDARLVGVREHLHDGARYPEGPCTDDTRDGALTRTEIAPGRV
jgi:hypothetical protein